MCLIATGFTAAKLKIHAAWKMSSTLGIFMSGCSVDYLVHWILKSSSLDLCCKSQVLEDRDFEVCLLII